MDFSVTTEALLLGDHQNPFKASPQTHFPGPMGLSFLLFHSSYQGGLLWSVCMCVSPNLRLYISSHFHLGI